MTFSGWIAVLAGWYVTEIGRQPWIVYGILKTADAVAPHGPTVMITSLTIYIILYAFLMISYLSVIFYMIKKAIKNNITAAKGA